MSQYVKAFSLFSEFDISLFKLGKHYKLYEKMGSHELEFEGETGVYFAVWAPNANHVNVVGDFNGWDRHSHELKYRWDNSGIWEGFIPHMRNGDKYKYIITTRQNTFLEKGDPYALSWEQPPRTASIVSTTFYQWNDGNWMDTRYKHNSLTSPISVYEMHIGSWMRSPDDPDVWFSYRDIAEKLVPYLKEMNFTHVEFMPVMEHPFSLSWGYQITGYFAASSRYGTPQDLMYLIDQLHQNGIGVILDWVPSHYPGDAHGLFQFDGTSLYEHEDPRKGFHPDWQSYIFNYGRNEVRSFLISNAYFWFGRYHADGMRVDAVTSMLFLNYSREDGEWIPNQYGGNENIEAIEFLKELNQAVYKEFPDVQMIAEESSSWPNITKPVHSGGLGFGLKWMMGWMHDTLDYFELDPWFRKFNQNLLTFSSVYVFNENFMLPLSHDEVVHGKSSLIYKMQGDEWQKFANLRLMYLYMYTHPGSKLLFMGGEFAQTTEWNVTRSLDWHLLQYESHAKMKVYVSHINGLYRNEPSLYENSYTPAGFEWIDTMDIDNSILIYKRKGNNYKLDLVVVLNFTPEVRRNYRVGLPLEGTWKVIFNSDHEQYWGTGIGNEYAATEEINWMNQPYSSEFDLPPLGGLVLKFDS